MAMEEETPAVKNKGLLITAIIVGVVVVILYQIRISQVASSSRGEQVSVLVFRQNMTAGDVITSTSVEERMVRKEAAAGFGDVVTGGIDQIPMGSTLNRSVHRGTYLRWDLIQGGRSYRPSEAVKSTLVGFPLRVSPAMAPGAILSNGDRVAVIGNLAIKGKPLKPYIIIQGARVVEIGGVPARTHEISGRRRSLQPRGQRSYRKLTIEVSPETALELQAVLSHVVGQTRILVLSPADADKIVGSPRVADELRGMDVMPPRAGSAAP